MIDCGYHWPICAYAPHGYIRSGPLIWLPYDSAGGPPHSAFGDYDPDDLDLFVFPGEVPAG